MLCGLTIAFLGAFIAGMLTFSLALNSLQAMLLGLIIGLMVNLISLTRTTLGKEKPRGHGIQSG